jgi:segregation and condensation protein A
MEAIEKVMGNQSANERVYDVIMTGDEITWQSILFDLVKNQQMDPWAVDLTALSEQFLEYVRHMQITNFRVNGKIVLATSMLLKLKTQALLDHDINALDTLLASQDELEESLDEEGSRGRERIHVEGIPKVYPRTPQPRQRAVSIYDLVEALEQALEVNVRRQRRVLFSHPEVLIPTKSIDLHGAMDSIHERVKEHYDAKEETLTFDQLITDNSKLGKIFVFMPLLHLTTARKTDMEQPEHFSTIYITLAQEGLQAAPGVEVGEMPGAEIAQG